MADANMLSRASRDIGLAANLTIRTNSAAIMAVFKTRFPSLILPIAITPIAANRYLLIRVRIVMDLHVAAINLAPKSSLTGNGSVFLVIIKTEKTKKN